MSDSIIHKDTLGLNDVTPETKMSGEIECPSCDKEMKLNITATKMSGQIECPSCAEEMNLDVTAKKKTEMDGPSDNNHAFFAYGIFRRGELGFLSIADLVERVVGSASVSGNLFLRDGLPIIDPLSRGGEGVPGHLIYFKDGHHREAYARINRLEPYQQYKWKETTAQGVRCNYLVGRSPRKGSVYADEGWEGRNDPLFVAALQVVQDALELNADFEWDLKPMFGLQMAYLLLWSSIERYSSLRYHLGTRATAKVMQMADDPQFKALLKKRVSRKHRVRRTDRPKGHCQLNRDKPRSSLSYYYQIRHNITHRGKGVIGDHKVVKESLSELLDIFKELLDTAFESSLNWSP